MSKKILSIFIMVMALSLLGVSCSNKTTNPNDNPPPIVPPPPTVKEITDKQIKDALKTALKGLKVNDTDAVKDGAYSKGKYTVNAAATKVPEKATTKKNLEDKKAGIKGELGKIGIVLDEKTDYTVTAGSGAGDPGTVTLKVSAKEGYKLPAGTSDTIKIEITSDGKTWK